jgi:cyclic beta-1,2-glucan synthetase
MFEFFMPELLLESRRGSLSFEALRYAVHCQKERGRKKGLPFGVSESAYYSFDRDLNYLYKAHGVQALALCGGMNKEYVISPYSTFLALSHSFNACMTNFARLSQPEFTHGKYGCFEAIDLTPHRTGAGEGVVKSHMAHHVGMSMGGIANALSDGILKKLFLSDEMMAGATELLEEKIMTGERIIDIKKLRDRSQPEEQTEESTAFNLLRPEMSIAANHKLAVFTTDTGLYYGRYMGRSTMVKSPDFSRRPEGMFFTIVDGEREIPFHLTAYDKGGSLERSVVSGENHVEYYVKPLISRSFHYVENIIIHTKI